MEDLQQSLGVVLVHTPELDYTQIATEGLLEWVDASRTQFLVHLKKGLAHLSNADDLLENYTMVIDQYQALTKERISLYFEGMGTRGIDFSPAYKPLRVR